MRTAAKRTVRCGGCGPAGPVCGEAITVAQARRLGWRRPSAGWLCDACGEWDERAA